MAVLTIILAAILWRLRGIMGWPFTLLFALLCAYVLYPVLGYWSLLYALWVFAGEPTGWKPKLIVDKRDWLDAAWHGFRIGGIGAIAVPLSSWLYQITGDPQIKCLSNPRPFELWFWSSQKYLLDWRGAWNEVYFGFIYILILLQISAGSGVDLWLL